MAANRLWRQLNFPPAGWQRGGLRPANAKILRFGSGADVALTLFDDDPQGHADWNTEKLQGPELKPGDRMTLEWEEIYNIGSAEWGKVVYTNLPAGLYRFRIEALDWMGIPTVHNGSSLVIVTVAIPTSRSWRWQQPKLNSKVGWSLPLLVFLSRH